MDNNFNQMDNQDFNQYEYQAQPTANYAMGTVPRKPNILKGTLGALIAAGVGVVVWVIIAALTGYVFFILGAAIAFLAMLLYEKFAKGINLVGMLICLVFTCVAIYLGNRWGSIWAIAQETGFTVSQSKSLFDWLYYGSEELQMEYIRTMVLSYVVGIGYTLVMIFNGLKKRR